MKKVNFKKIIVTTMFFGAAITSMAQSKEAKKAIKEVEKLNPCFRYTANDKEFDPVLPQDVATIILLGGWGITYIDNDNVWTNLSGDQVFVTPGRHDINLGYQSGNSVASTTLSADFESGKFYKMGIKRSGSVFKANTSYVEEITDPELILKVEKSLEEERERRKALYDEYKALYDEFNNKFLKYQEQNPTRLEGNWISEKSLGLGIKQFIEFSFDGEKIRYKASQSKMNFPLEVEGRLFYCENIIVCVPEKVYSNGKDRTNNGHPISILYYTIINDKLQLQKNKLDPLGYSGMLKRN